MKVAVFGLGEAGSLITSDLAKRQLTVVAFDPAEVPTPPGVKRCEDPIAAVGDAECILAVTAAADSPTALNQALAAIEPGTTYADLATATPETKRELAENAAEAGVEFVDVALMGSVPGSGFATPAFASGSGAAAYARFANANGGKVEVVEGGAGEAAARKLLRSVVTKGLTALIVESLRAGEAHGASNWLWPHIVDTISRADEALLSRLLEGTPPHLERRISEMETTAEFLSSLDVDAIMTRATFELLRTVDVDGIPTRSSS